LASSQTVLRFRSRSVALMSVKRRPDGGRIFNQSGFRRVRMVSSCNATGKNVRITPPTVGLLTPPPVRTLSSPKAPMGRTVPRRWGLTVEETSIAGRERCVPCYRAGRKIVQILTTFTKKKTFDSNSSRLCIIVDVKPCQIYQGTERLISE
jgi:hypothetical protein